MTCQECGGSVFIPGQQILKNIKISYRSSLKDGNKMMHTSRVISLW